MMQRAAAAVVAFGALVAGLFVTRRAQGASLPAARPQGSDDGLLDVMDNWAADALPDLAPRQLPQAQAPAAPDDTIVRVVAAGSGWTEVAYKDGRIVRRTGVRSWRNNNPGNIEHGAYASGQGAVGSDGRFAVFPTLQAGRRAKERLIFEGANYRDLSLSAAIARYAPPTENNTAWYIASVVGAVAGSDRRMADYTADERALIMAAMERVEGYKVGSVSVISGGVFA